MYENVSIIALFGDEQIEPFIETMRKEYVIPFRYVKEGKIVDFMKGTMPPHYAEKMSGVMICFKYDDNVNKC